MNNAATRSLVSTRNPSQVAELASRLAILATSATLFLLVTLHVLSPEFSPSWRVVSEYAFGHYAWVLSLMFLSWSRGRLSPHLACARTRRFCLLSAKDTRRTRLRGAGFALEAIRCASRSRGH
jgi:hypothetical protein